VTEDPPGLGELAERLRSPDGDTRGRALAALVGRGAEATPVLLAALGDPDGRVRALSAEGLGMLGDDARAADPLAAALHDQDDDVRSRAAVALLRLGDPRGLPAVVATLNDGIDVLHSDVSRSVYALMGLGPAAVPALVPLLGDPDEGLRYKAAYVIEQVSRARQGQPGGWDELHAATERYRADSSDGARRDAAAAVEAWLESHPQAGA
jgi:HEAT repeat protein